MNRTRDYYRKARVKAIRRKKRISDSFLETGDHYYNIDGKYHKGKIHCSCPMCKNGTPFSTLRKLARTAEELTEV